MSEFIKADEIPDLINSYKIQKPKQYKPEGADPVYDFDIWISAMKKIGVSEETHYHPLLQIARRLRDELERLRAEPPKE